MNGAPRSDFVPVMGHEIHVTCWGDASAPAVVLWHGLARTGRDFDELARELATDHFVLCPDTLGRGLSSWATDPAAHYRPSYYARLAVALLDHYGIDRAAWLGTSMGGQIGMRVAAGPAGDRLTALVINDIGPEVPRAAIERIVTYASALPDFDSFAKAETWFRQVYQPFGPAPDSFWTRMAETSLRRRGDGRLTLHYDPVMVEMLEANAEEQTAWDLYETITTPTALLRGAQSDLLTAEIAARMVRSGPKPALTEFPACGHAPSMASPADAGLVAGLLRTLAKA
ncbi:alpha/beta fold hydrolase [Mesobacterium pallidum]|uniref:alpha/beta fold hydrolase n=1 Tax=Mesobacterium pallidum TaxID=2872037 RepID=UPI001EE2B303|nr:alpha/beta hydrolase [Mesobacterium pallidum]